MCRFPYSPSKTVSLFLQQALVPWPSWAGFKVKSLKAGLESGVFLIALLKRGCWQVWRPEQQTGVPAVYRQTGWWQHCSSKAETRFIVSDAKIRRNKYQLSLVSIHFFTSKVKELPKKFINLPLSHGYLNICVTGVAMSHWNRTLVWTNEYQLITTSVSVFRFSFTDSPDVSCH